MPWLRRDDRRDLRRRHLEVERESVSGVRIEAHAVQGHRDRVREDVRDHEWNRHSAGDGTALRGADHDGVAVRIDRVAPPVLRQEAAPDVVRLVGLGVRQPHLGVKEIRAAAQVHGGQRDAGAGVRNRNSPLRHRRTVDLRKARITLRTLRSLRTRVALQALSARVALHALRAQVALEALSPLRARRPRVTLGTLCTRVALRTLGTGVAGITLRTLGTGVAPVAVRTPGAVHTPAILHVAGAVLIHVLGGEVTRAILVQIPAMQTVRTLRTGVALGASRTGVTLGSLSAGVPVESLNARLTRFALRAECTGRAVIPAVALGAGSAVHTSAILHIAGAV